MADPDQIDDPIQVDLDLIDVDSWIDWTFLE